MYQTQSERSVTASRHYQIRIEGKIDPGWLDWFNGMEIVSTIAPEGKCISTLTGEVIDQVALRGLVNRLWDLNLTVSSIQEIDPEALSNEC